jgi:hypothetical protein
MADVDATATATPMAILEIPIFIEAPDKKSGLLSTNERNDPTTLVFAPSHKRKIFRPQAKLTERYFQRKRCTSQTPRESHPPFVILAKARCVCGGAWHLEARKKGRK